MRKRLRLLKLIEGVRDSYWFVPGLLALCGLVAGAGLVLLDGLVGDAWLGRSEWLTGSRPAGARALLSTVASSMITVAGVVFSITLAAVTYASGQYGPRLLTNFRRDRGNQATLGVFIATFLYCLTVLRTIRSAEETSAETAGAVREAFVPHFAVYGGLLLALASIAMLIYFVHHVTDGIHINNVVARIGRDLLKEIRHRPVGEDKGGDRAPSASFSSAVSIAAVETGYLAAIDHDALVRIAREHDAVFRLRRRPGDFVHRGRPLLDAEPSSAVTEAMRAAVVDSFAVGRQRTGNQDMRFAIDELVEIAARALSPGVNDPFTAIACIDWLGAVMSELDGRPRSSSFRRDPQGVIRLVIEPLGYEDYLRSAFGQLRPYVACDPNARAHALAVLSDVERDIRSDTHRWLILAERERLAAAPTD